MLSTKPIKPIPKEGAINYYEPRFIISPRKDTKQFITQTNTTEYSKTSLAARNSTDRYQKFIIKREHSSTMLRFDNHPQPYLSALNNTLVMQHQKSSESKWEILLFEKRSGNQDWTRCIYEDQFLLFHNCIGHQFKVAFLNIMNNSLLCFRNQELGFEKAKIASFKDLSIYQFHYYHEDSLFVMECVEYNIGYDLVAQLAKLI